MGFDVTGGNIFVAELWGPVHVFNANTGAPECILSPGPEVAGSSAWEDAAMGLRAYQRQNGEYEVLTENSGYDGKCNLFRLSPLTVATPTFSPAAGVYATAQTVTIGTTTYGATIMYTTDGSTPSQSNGTVYSAR